MINHFCQQVRIFFVVLLEALDLSGEIIQGSKLNVQQEQFFNPKLVDCYELIMPRPSPFLKTDWPVCE